MKRPEKLSHGKLSLALKMKKLIFKCNLLRVKVVKHWMNTQSMESPFVQKQLK